MTLRTATVEKPMLDHTGLQTVGGRLGNYSHRRAIPMRARLSLSAMA
jgi:hypothetical protein